MRRMFALISFMTVLGGYALAHGNEKHVMGTVTRVSPTAITVQTQSKTMVEVLLSADTTFTKGNASAAPSDVHVGDRVVIHAAVTEGGKLTARTVQIGVAKAADLRRGSNNVSG